MPQIYQSIHAKAWLNTVTQTHLKSLELKITGEFEDITRVGKKGTGKLYQGWTGEGTMTRYKTDSTLTAALAEAYKTGVMPDMKIITSITLNGATERVAVSDITISEFYLAKFEGKDSIEEEIPFSFGEFEILDSI